MSQPIFKKWKFHGKTYVIFRTLRRAPENDRGTPSGITHYGGILSPIQVSRVGGHYE